MTAPLHLEQHRWTTICAEIDGAPRPEMAGQQEDERRAYFAYLADAQAWLEAQRLECFEPAGEPCPVATPRYYGPTDSRSNAWSATARREVLAA